jgi:hypothetical protein
MRPPLLLRVCVALALLMAAAVAATADEITTDKEEVIKGAEVVSIDAGQVVYKVGKNEVKRPLAEVLKIDYRAPAGPAKDAKYARVDLTDGTTLLATSWAIKGVTLELTLTSGAAIRLPVVWVRGILATAHDEKDRADWDDRLISARGKEALVLKKQATKKVGKGKDARDVPAFDDKGNPRYVIFNLDATIGRGNAADKVIRMVVEGRVVDVHQGDVHGLIFANRLPPQAPPALCKVLDVRGNVVVASRVEANRGGVSVTTSAGLKLAFRLNEVARIDYTPGRLDFLSVLPPTRVAFEAPGPFAGKVAAGKRFVYRDSNLDGAPIRLGGKAHRQGLTLLPDVEMTWALNGKYKRFDAVIGIDDETKAEGEVTVTIVGNNKELISVPVVSRTTKGKDGEPVAPVRRPRRVALDVTGVVQLKVIVKAKDDLSGLSIGVSLGDAKLTK